MSDYEKDNKIYKSLGCCDKVSYLLQEKHYTFEGGGNAHVELYKYALPNLLTDYRRLEKENAELKANVDYLNRQLADELSGLCDKKIFKEKMELKSQLEKAKEALRFYANEDSWGDVGGVGFDRITRIMSDCYKKESLLYGGKLARQTLAELESK